MWAEKAHTYLLFFSFFLENSTFQGKGRGAYQFWVEFFRRSPPVHGHEGLCGCGHAVAIEVEGALPVSIRAGASLGTGGDKAAGPRIYLSIERDTLEWTWQHSLVRCVFCRDIHTRLCLPSHYVTKRDMPTYQHPC